MKTKTCSWSCSDTLLSVYHDKEWGVPVHDDRQHFEFICLEVMQCGLSWLLMLKKRQALKDAFSQFDVDKICQYTEKDIERIMNTPEIIHSERKIKAIIEDAKIFKKIQNDFSSFDQWIWSFTDGKTRVYRKHDLHAQARNELSDIISKELKRYGMKYLGSITVYAHLQAVGIINDHDRDCWLYEYVNHNFPIEIIEE